MEKIEYEGEIFYFNQGRFYDRTFCEVPKKDSEALYKRYFSSIDLSVLKFSDFLCLINQLDEGENYSEGIKLIEKGFEIYFDMDDYAKLMLPKLFRFYRMRNQPDKVVDLWTKFWSKKTYRIESASLYIVLGAAYCDMDDFAEAEQFAKRAYRLLGGHADEYLQNLYTRINSAKY